MTYLHSVPLAGAMRHATPPNQSGTNNPGFIADDDPLDAEGAAQLHSILTEIQRQQAADDVLVAWHDGGGESPVLLFGDGADHPRSAAEEDMIASAAEMARTCHGPRSDWRELGGDGAGALLTTAMPAHGGVVTVTTLFARIGSTTRVRARDAAARLAPLVQPFFWMWSLRRRLAARLRGLTTAVDNTDVGIVLVDRHGQMLFSNAAATATLRQSDGLRLVGGLLGGAKLADTLRLRAAVEHVFDADAPVRGRDSAPVVALYRRDRRPLLVAVVRPAGESAAGGGDTAVLYLFDPEQNLAQLIEPACKLYGLSPVETRLTCLLADGVSLAEAAEKMRVREQTARSYLKQIFGKTQTNRQAELVWLMLKSSVRTAPSCRTSFV